MAFEAYVGHAGPTTTVYLAGELTDEEVGRLRRLIEAALARPMDRLVLRMAELTSVTAGAVRCLAFAQQRLPAGADIVVDGAGEPVRRMLAAGGLDQCVTVVTGTLTAGKAA
ncbi:MULTISPECIES: STAS domain-containing protein [Streptomycetaceae]|uniref:STAS domain-containing protein n=1 Tax=Streptantibioticus cattleyicolor (strain ATCC 35852 / DSM 46488 / JCM 4925 / NBRC 14057 / NRRL 8057) TaxID=1003195 RepID=F8JUZ7_STREN|nr:MULTISPECIES: STAS domain-containing protein [Streptomycetaceae]AEW98164.1 hypothetical protein SCATT_57930 [Streptantibioticus cattleyicolor NRRL 8057 = DSM 46488]MYS62549.1 STAS domain-containing protein [Streptomyces sp. SID5468]CCB78478.1 protein of unknown function [Streptantibioticus cattleyicolor NRRL 8057 = DSM 46488]